MEILLVPPSYQMSQPTWSATRYLFVFLSPILPHNVVKMNHVVPYGQKELNL